MPNKQDSKQNKSADGFDFAPAWRPDLDDGPVLEGTMEALEEGFSEYGDYPIVTIATDSGEAFAWHAMTQVATNQLVKATPKIGERLRISYGGKIQSRNQSRNPYTRWRVENLTHPVTAESILDKYATKTAVSRPSGEFSDEPPF